MISLELQARAWYRSLTLSKLDHVVRWHDLTVIGLEASSCNLQSASLRVVDIWSNPWRISSGFLTVPWRERARTRPGRGRVNSVAQRRATRKEAPPLLQAPGSSPAKQWTPPIGHSRARQRRTAGAGSTHRARTPLIPRLCGWPLMTCWGGCWERNAATVTGETARESEDGGRGRLRLRVHRTVGNRTDPVHEPIRSHSQIVSTFFLTPANRSVSPVYQTVF
jgi:hypothetical protein